MRSHWTALFSIGTPPGATAHNAVSRGFHRLLIASLIWAALYGCVAIPLVVGRKLVAALLVAFLSAICFVCLALLRRGRMVGAARLWVAVHWLAAVGVSACSGGVQSSAQIMIFGCVLAAGCLLGRRIALVLGGVSLFADTLMALAALRGYAFVHFFPAPPFAALSIAIYGYTISLVLLDGFMRSSTESMAEVRRSERELREILDGTSDGIFIHDVDGRILAINKQARAMYALPEGLDLAIAGLSSDRPGYSRKDAMAHIRRALETGPVTFEWLAKRTTGEEFWTEVALRACTLGGQTRVLAAVRDISERKREAEERDRLERKLADAQKLESIGRLASSVAHDFNNLLTVVNGYSDLALDRMPREDPLRNAVEEVRSAGERATQLTSRLLAFGRSQVLQPRPLDLNATLAGMEKMLRHVLGEGIVLELKYAPSLEAVRADASQIDQVLMNLVVNARDAMPSGGVLTIETASVDLDEKAAAAHTDVRPGPYVRLSVIDTGSGMDASTLRNVFEPFFTTKAPGRGTGLGLAIVHGIVRQSDGWLAVDSAPGHGTRFDVYLPRTKEPVVGAPKAVPVPGASAGSSATTILLAEDEAAVRRLASVMLRTAGYQVLEAESGTHALAIAADFAGTIHVLLTDVMMPGMQGTELARLLKLRRPGTAVLFMSGYTGEPSPLPEDLIRRGSFLQKPFTSQDLTSKIEQVLKALATPSILIADSDPSVRALFRTILSDAGYIVLEAADGNAAAEIMRHRPPHLAVVDLTLPIRDPLPEVPLIAIAAAFNGTARQAASTLDARATLCKPVTGEALLGAVRNVLRTR